MPTVINDMMGGEKEAQISTGNHGPDEKIACGLPLPSLPFIQGGNPTGNGVLIWQQVMSGAMEQGLSAGPFTTGTSTMSRIGLNVPLNHHVSGYSAGDFFRKFPLRSGGSDGTDHFLPCQNGLLPHDTGGDHLNVKDRGEN